MTSMVQLTLRVPEALRDRVKSAADIQGMSVNAYAQAVLSAATDPAYAPDPASALRERLRAAGLLVEVTPDDGEAPDQVQLAAARRAAGRGTPLSGLVAAEREERG